MQDLFLSSIPLSELEILIDNAVTRALKKEKPEPKQPSGYITRKNVCELLKITYPTLHSWLKQGRLKAYHVGGRTLFKEDEVLEAVKPVSYSINK